MLRPSPNHGTLAAQWWIGIQLIMMENIILCCANCTDLNRSTTKEQYLWSTSVQCRTWCDTASLCIQLLVTPFIDQSFPVSTYSLYYSNLSKLTHAPGAQTHNRREGRVTVNCMDHTKLGYVICNFEYNFIYITISHCTVYWCLSCQHEILRCCNI